MEGLQRLNNAKRYNRRPVYKIEDSLLSAAVIYPFIPSFVIFWIIQNMCAAQVLCFAPFWNL